MSGAPETTTVRELGRRYLDPALRRPRGAAARFELVVEVKPGDAPPMRRLARLFKCAWRAYGVRVVAAREVES